MGNITSDEDEVFRPRRIIEHQQNVRDMRVVRRVNEKRFDPVDASEISNHVKWTVMYNPPLPGRVFHHHMGNCRIWASRVANPLNPRDTTYFLVTLVDAVEDKGVLISKKRGVYYELPALLLLGDGNSTDLVRAVEKMITLVRYNDKNPGESEVHIATFNDGNNENKGYTITLREFLASKEQADQDALLNFMSDYPEWCDSVEFNRIYESPSMIEGKHCHSHHHYSYGMK
jgi:hypothetical protein